MSKRRQPTDHSTRNALIAAFAAIIVALIYLVGSRLPPPVPTITSTPAPLTKNILFASAQSTATLNSDLVWDAGSSEQSSYTLYPDAIKLVAGPYTWPGLPTIAYRYHFKGDFDVQVRVVYSSSVPRLEGAAQMAGLIVRPVKARLTLGDEEFPINWVVNSKATSDEGLGIGCRGKFVDYPNDMAFLKIERASNLLRCAYSKDGEHWTWITPKADIAGLQDNNIEVALFVYSTNKDTVSAEFTDWVIHSQ